MQPYALVTTNHGGHAAAAWRHPHSQAPNHDMSMVWPCSYHYLSGFMPNSLGHLFQLGQMIYNQFCGMLDIWSFNAPPLLRETWILRIFWSGIAPSRPSRCGHMFHKSRTLRGISSRILFMPLVNSFSDILSGIGGWTDIGTTNQRLESEALGSRQLEGQLGSHNVWPHIHVMIQLHVHKCHGQVLRTHMEPL